MSLFYALPDGKPVPTFPGSMILCLRASGRKTGSHFSWKRASIRTLVSLRHPRPCGEDPPTPAGDAAPTVDPRDKPEDDDGGGEDDDGGGEDDDGGGEDDGGGGEGDDGGGEDDDGGGEGDDGGVRMTTVGARMTAVGERVTAVGVTAEAGALPDGKTVSTFPGSADASGPCGPERFSRGGEEGCGGGGALLPLPDVRN